MTFAKGQTAYLLPEKNMTLAKVIKEAHALGLASRSSASVALYATSQRWMDLANADVDLSGLPISVVGLIRYMVNVLDSSVTPIETTLNAVTAAKRAA
jgi:hypothetical protein